VPPGSSIDALSAVGARTPGSDAERRAALWLAGELRRTGRAVRVQTYWCRPEAALAGAWHVALALAGSLVSIWHPAIGVGLLAAALSCLLLDAAFGVSPGRRLTPERASQNVIASAPARPGTRTLRIEAAYGAPRIGLLRATRAGRTAGARAGALSGLGALLVAWLLAVAAARLHGSHDTAIAVLQLIPTIACVLGLAALLDTAASPAAAGPAVTPILALALVRALDAAPPAHLAVELVLRGAERGGAIGRRADRACVLRLTEADTLTRVLEQVDALDARRPAPASGAPIPV
jgi:hypothetical protein